MRYRDFEKRTVIIAVIVLTTFLLTGCTVNINQPNTANNANNNVVSPPQKSPVSTPTPRRVSTFNEEFLLTPGATKEVRFTIPKPEKTARLEGGLRVKENKRIDLYVFPVADYSSLTDKSKKSVNLVQIKNERIDEKLEPGDYVLVFENTPADESASVAAAFFLAYD